MGGRVDVVDDVDIVDGVHVADEAAEARPAILAKAPKTPGI